MIKVAGSNLADGIENIFSLTVGFCSASDVNKLDTILSTDANVSITAVRSHRVSLNTLDIADESFFHTY